MSKIYNWIRKYPLLVVFATFMMVYYCLDMYASRKEFSELENRSLKQRPKFSWASLVSNEYTKKYEEYINDQFVFRDQWISIKSVAESAIAKVENNGVAYGRDHYLFGVKTTVDAPQMEKNADYLNQFLESYQCHVTFGLIPNSYEMMRDYLPTGLGAIQIQQQPVIDRLYSQVRGRNLETLDVSGALASLNGMALTAYTGDPGSYYRTDHHWRIEAAHTAYAAYCQARGLDYATLEELAPLRREEANFYGTYYSKAKRYGQPADTLVWYDIPTTSVRINEKDYVTDEKNNKIPVTGLYQTEKFATRDKYAAFLYGNNGLTVIKSDNNKNKQPGKTSRLLLVKDSYANSLVPFLTYSYDEIYVVDLRGLGQKMSTLLKKTEFDDLWVLYNFENFESDRNFARLIL